MLIPNGLYSDFDGITILEELSIALARAVLAIQSELNKNPKKLDYVDITQNEDEKTIDINWKDIPCNIISGKIEIINLFNDTIFTPGTGDYPFNQTYLLGAAIHIFMFQGLQKLNTILNTEGENLVSFSIESVTEFDLQDKLLFSGSATLPLIYQSIAGKQVTFGQPYLN